VESIPDQAPQHLIGPNYRENDAFDDFIPSWALATLVLNKLTQSRLSRVLVSLPCPLATSHRCSEMLSWSPSPLSTRRVGRGKPRQPAPLLGRLPQSCHTARPPGGSENVNGPGARSPWPRYERRSGPQRYVLVVCIYRGHVERQGCLVSVSGSTCFTQAPAVDHV
jgi:hypothetical protein